MLVYFQNHTSQRKILDSSEKKRKFCSMEVGFHTFFFTLLTGLSMKVMDTFGKADQHLPWELK